MQAKNALLKNCLGICVNCFLNCHEDDDTLAMAMATLAEAAAAAAAAQRSARICIFWGRCLNLSARDLLRRTAALLLRPLVVVRIIA